MQPHHLLEVQGRMVLDLWNEIYVKKLTYRQSIDELTLAEPVRMLLKAGAFDNKYGEFGTYFIILIGMPIFCYIVFAFRWHIFL